MGTLEEKLKDLDKEIHTLYQFCVSKGYNPYQIEKSAEPLFSLVKERRRKKLVSLSLRLAVVVAVLAILVYCDPLYRFVAATSRLAFIQILPLYDWTHLREETCLVTNPYFTGPQVKEEDCKLCEDLVGTVPKLDNISQILVAENYLKQDKPFIVTDGMQDWLAREKFNVHFLNQLYHTEESLSTFPQCMFLSNVRLPMDTAKAILKKAASGEIENYFAHWENCHKSSAKALRQFYKRPYFFPPMLETAEPNWVFISNRYTGKKSKPADIAVPMMWIGVVKGQMKTILQAREPCKDICSKLYSTLKAGEILVVTDLMWLLDYIPDSEGETVAIGGGAYFD